MININPIEIIKAINASRILREESVATYVKKVAIEADELANIWEEIAKSIMSGNEIDTDKLEEMGAYRWVGFNNRPYTLINEFYKDVSAALGKNGGSKWVDKITFSLGGIIYNRDNANETLLELLANKDNHFFFSDDNQQDILKDLSSSIVAIRKEAAALQALSAHVDANTY